MNYLVKSLKKDEKLEKRIKIICSFNKAKCKKEGIQIMNSFYDDDINLLRQIRKNSTIYKIDYLFAKALFMEKVPNRLEWLKKQINDEKYIKMLEVFNDKG